MKIIDEILDKEFLSADQQYILSNPKSCLLNIETTGLYSNRSFVYMIGIIFFCEGQYHLQTLLAESKADERNLLYSLKKIVDQTTRVITYGGHIFSHRFLNNRFLIYQDELLLSEDNLQLDIQQAIIPFKDLLGLGDVKKVHIEERLGFDRKVTSDPEELIDLYMLWEREHDPQIQSLLTDHNKEDLLSLCQLLNYLTYGLFMDKCQCQLIDHHISDECLTLTLETPFSFPESLIFSKGSTRIDLQKNNAILTVPIYTGELRYYLPGSVKDYYYLPEEDQAIHKSLAQFVSPSHRKKATKANCYVRKSSRFIPIRQGSMSPCFKKEYKDSLFYIELTDQLFENDSSSSKLISALLYP